LLKIKNISDALMTTGEEIKERDLDINLVNGVVHEFDPIVAVITTQRFITLEDAQFMLMMHELGFGSYSRMNRMLTKRDSTDVELPGDVGYVWKLD
jgi:hypothetical protein